MQTQGIRGERRRECVCVPRETWPPSASASASVVRSVGPASAALAGVLAASATRSEPTPFNHTQTFLTTPTTSPVSFGATIGCVIFSTTASASQSAVLFAARAFLRRWRATSCQSTTTSCSFLRRRRASS